MGDRGAESQHMASMVMAHCHVPVPLLQQLKQSPDSIHFGVSIVDDAPVELIFWHNWLGS